MSTLDPRTPILVGGAQFTQRTAKANVKESLSPIEMMAKVATDAIADSGGRNLAAAIDTVSVVRFTADSPGDQGRLPKRMFRNPPHALAKRIGAHPRRSFYTATGGNTPQWLVNRTAEEIAKGECDVALLTVDADAFWAGLRPLEFGGLPRLQDAVAVVGYPIGGDTISVTSGVVSRIEVLSYAHGSTELLGIQIDAAINSGNSGGPVFNSRGECVGIAFQSLTGDAENIGKERERAFF